MHEYDAQEFVWEINTYAWTATSNIKDLLAKQHSHSHLHRHHPARLSRPASTSDNIVSIGVSQLRRVSAQEASTRAEREAFSLSPSEIRGQDNPGRVPAPWPYILSSRVTARRCRRKLLITDKISPTSQNLKLKFVTNRTIKNY